MKQKQMTRHGGMNSKNPNKDSEFTKYLRNCPDHKFHWKILFTTPGNTKLRKSFESPVKVLRKPTLSEQLDFDHLILFRNGVA